MREILCYYYCNYKHTHVHHRVINTNFYEGNKTDEEEKKIKRKENPHINKNTQQL